MKLTKSQLEKQKKFAFESEKYRLIVGDTFSIGQGYDGFPALKIQCKECGRDKFIVGMGSYYTCIKCPTCGWETCIHDG